MKIFFLLPFTLFALQALQASQDSIVRNQTFDLIEVWLDAQTAYEKLPGLSVVYLKNGEIYWSAALGYSNPDKQLKTQTSTLYSICSISKLFTSISIMKLYEEGKLRLDDEIHNLLPWFDIQQIHPGSGPLTVRRLLTHSSGLPREANAPYWTGPEFPFPSLREIKDGLANQETLYPAAKYFQYSNLAMALLGVIVEELSGVDFHTYVAENILKPLEMNDTYTSMPEELHGGQLALGFSSLTREGKREHMPFFDAKGIDPAAGFASSIDDLGKFAAWQLRLLGADEAEILKPSTLDYMQRVHWTDPDWKTTWGLGFVVSRDSEGTTMVGHGGSCPGYRSAFSVFPAEKSALASMINASGTNPGKYISGIRSLLKKTSQIYSKEETAENDTLPDLSEYVGFYQGQPWLSEIYIGQLADGLVLLSFPTDNPASSLSFFRNVGEDRFIRVRDDGELGEILKFVRDRDKNIIHFDRHGTHYSKIPAN